jgi:hypothetical protein
VTQTFTSTADSYVNQKFPKTNYGTRPTMEAAGSPVERGYVRFSVTGLAGTVSRATLRLYATAGSSVGFSVRGVTDNTWAETTITYNNAPAASPTITSSSGSFGTGWVSLDVTSLVSGNGVVSFALTSTAAKVVSLATREKGAAYAPQLVVEVTVPDSSPVNSSPPTISGSAVAGQTLTANPGTWSGTQPISYTYQWRRCDSTGAGCNDVTGATAQSFGLTAADVGSTMRVAVTASNSAGSSNAASAPTAVVVQLVPPANSSPPTISGSAVAGQTLTANPGTWSGTQPISYTYQWRRCDSTGAGCNDVTGATAQSYGLTAADVGSTMRVAVTASNSVGTSTAASSPTLVVEAVPPTNTSPPTITGTAQVNQTLTSDPGIWSGTQPIAYAFQWLRCDASGGSCSSIVGATATTYAVSPADVGSTIAVAVTASNSAGSATATSAQTAVVSAAPASLVIAAAGDLCSSSIGDCAAAANLLDSINPTAVLTLGDNAYQDGTLSEYNLEYKPYWGRQDAKVYPSPGNHDFHTANAQGYLDYFGARAPGLWYSYDLGTWHVISLAGDVGVSASAGSPQETFLKNDLAAHPAQCILAYWHEPRFSSGTTHGSDSGVSALWKDLYAAHADLILNGHEHNYERFAKQDPNEVADPNGIREIISGTGGADEGVYPFGTPIANSEVRNTGTPGVLKVTLHPGSYDWQFVPIAGASFTDAGSDVCSS